MHLEIRAFSADGESTCCDGSVEAFEDGCHVIAQHSSQPQTQAKHTQS